MASIREVAKIAGVSPATVSRVINGTANVDTDKTKRVYDAIKKTGFVPNEVARSLFRKSSKMIGLIIPSITNPFFTELADAVEKTADETGYTIVCYNTENNPHKEKSAVEILKSMNADGIIITSNNSNLINVLDKSDMKVVMIDRTLSNNSPYILITSDHYYGGRLATQCLLDCGCKNIVCASGLHDISSANDRFRGYRDVCKENGVEAKYIESVKGFTFEENLVDNILKLNPLADGIFACNDITALSIYKQLSNRGIKVPEDIQLIGFDDVMLAKLVTPELTTIAQPIKEMGKMAVKIITEEVDTLNLQKEIVFRPKLKLRQTTK